MADKVNLKITFVATNPDGTPYSSAILDYAGLPYVAFLAMEKTMVAALDQMTKLGDAGAELRHTKGYDKG